MRLTRKISARLSTRRRSRYAAPAVLVAALLASGGLYLTLAPAGATNATDDADTIADGKALFQVSCASCHGSNAEGIVTQRGNQYGPTLIGVGAVTVALWAGLPPAYLLVLACPVMMMFMMGGMNMGSNAPGNDADRKPDAPAGPQATGPEETPSEFGPNSAPRG